MVRKPSNQYRYAEDDPRPFFLNAQHYGQACRIFKSLDSSIPQSSRRVQSKHVVYKPVRELKFAEENRLLPVDGHLGLYSDLLGFTRDVHEGGMDSLPDYYGGALIAARCFPQVKVYLLSDSCIAFAPTKNATEFLRFVHLAVSRWVSNGLVPQSYIGYGSFVERKPFSDLRPPNFVGVQVAGTALTDAVAIEKEKRPPGSRILLSASAKEHLSCEQVGHAISDGQCVELLLRKPLSHDMFEATAVPQTGRKDGSEPCLVV